MSNPTSRNHRSLLLITLLTGLVLLAVSACRGAPTQPPPSPTPRPPTLTPTYDPFEGLLTMPPSASPTVQTITPRQLPAAPQPPPAPKYPRLHRPSAPPSR